MDNSIAQDFASALDNESGQQQETQAFASLQEFEDATGLSAFALDTSIYHCEAVDAFTIDGETQLNATYSCEYGDVFTTQIWNIITDIGALTNNTYQQYQSNTGRIVNYYIDKMDGSLYAVTSINGSILIITADNTIPLKNFLAIFND